MHERRRRTWSKIVQRTMARYELQGDFNHKLAQRNNSAKRKSQSEDAPAKPVIFFAISGVIYAVLSFLLKLENRTREIGLAVFSLSSPQLDLYTYDDFGGYAITQTLIQLYQPTEILLPHTAGWYLYSCIVILISSGWRNAHNYEELLRL